MRLSQIGLLIGTVVWLGGSVVRAADEETYAEHLERMKSELLQHINAARERHRLMLLEPDRRLMAMAQGMAQRMAIENQLLSRGNAAELMEFFGWTHFVENTDVTDLLSPRELVQRWLQTHPFRDHVLDPRIHLGGVGIQTTRAGRIFVAFNGARHQDRRESEPVAPPAPRGPQPPVLR